MTRAMGLRGTDSAPLVDLVPAAAQIEGPVVDLAGSGRARVEPKIAVVLSADVPAGALPGAVARAVTGVFLAVDIVDEDATAGRRFLLGEQLLPLDLTGELRLSVNGAPAAREAVAQLGDPVTRIAELASAVGGLHAGETVLLGLPSAGGPAGPGTLLLAGPLDSTLSAHLRVTT